LTLVNVWHFFLVEYRVVQYAILHFAVKKKDLSVNRLPGMLLLFVVVSFAGGCAVSNLGISATGTDTDQPVSFESFEVKAVDLPAFLGPIIVSNFSVALAERGLQPVISGGEAIAILRYIQEDLTTAQQHDDFEERIDVGSDTRFVARIAVEIRQAGSQDIAWAGSIQRLHTIRPGDYMHTGRASVAFLDSFRELLQDYPQLVRNDD
jgi:hypothetical protein